MGVFCAQTSSLSPLNIMKAFEATSIYPLNPRAMDPKIGPSEIYERPTGLGEGPSKAAIASFAEVQHELPEWELIEIFNEDANNLPIFRHYYIDFEGQETDDTVGHEEHQDKDEDHASMSKAGSASGKDKGSFSNLLNLPRICAPPKSKVCLEPRVDYNRSILLTEAHHV